MARRQTLALVVVAAAGVALLAAAGGAGAAREEPSDSDSSGSDRRPLEPAARLTASSFAAAATTEAARFGSSGGLAECWAALLELRACTDEILLFFLNGEGRLGQGCCRAVRTITYQCWPSMLTSVGFTPEQGDVLAGYCVTVGEAPRLPPAPAPARAH